MVPPAGDESAYDLLIRNGQVVETGTTDRIFDAPETDYTRALIAAAFSIEAAPEGIVAQ